MYRVATIFFCICSVLGSNLSANSQDLSFPLNTNSVDIDFRMDSQHALNVTIRTERLLIRSIEPRDLPTWIALFSDTTVMEKFATGVRSPELSTIRLNTFCERWQSMNPYSAFAITVINENQSCEEATFIGIIALAHGDEPGIAQVSYLLFEPYWNKGYGTEAAIAIIHNYAHLLMLKGFGPENSPLRQIVATSRVDNTASCKLLEAIGMECIGISEKFGHNRKHYVIDVANLRPR